jgi:hypothetical protein
MKEILLTVISCIAILIPSMGQKKPRPAPSDLTGPPLEEADISTLPSGIDRIEIFLLMGQSNMKGRGVMPSEPLRNSQIIMMHKGTDDWYLARHPLHLVGSPKDFSGADNAGVGPGLAFAQTLAKVYPKTRIALIPCAKGGSNIHQWRKGQVLYDETIRRAKLALTNAPKGKARIAGALWLQGESDSTNSDKIQAYSERLRQLIDNLRTDTGIPDLPFIACTIGEKKTPELRSKINAILLDLPKLRPHTACIDGRSFAKFIDSVHFDTATQEEHGRLYTAKYLDLTRKQNSGAKETDLKSLPPIQFAEGEKHFTAANQERVDIVKQIPGLVALWDFVQRRDSWKTNNPFISIPGESGGQTYELEPRNISLDFWHEGKEATLDDFELYGRGPFGQAVRFSSPKSKTDLPVLTVPRKNLHDSPLDIKGKGKSVSMVVWLLYERGNHAIAGMWHEGTVTPRGQPPVVQEPGKRQFGLFAGLQANKGGIGAHISENGGSSFGNIYARHLASEPTKMKQIKPDMKPSQTDKYWNAVGMVFHNEENRVTAYVNGSAKEVWVENPKESRFFEHAYRAWQQGQLADIDGIQPGEDVDFPKDQYYRLPEDEPVETKIIERTSDRIVRLETYPFSKIEATYQVKPDGKLGKPLKRDLVALKSNPYYFGYDIYAPKKLEQGGPFTIGRVIHSNRHATLSAWIGGVAVFDRALSDEEMKKLATIGNCSGRAK